jgi:predicted dehydrogenase
MLGIIALHGIRSAKLTFGSKVVVLGLGLLGLLTIQMLRAYGCEVIALDPAQDKTTLANKLGFTHVTNQAEALARLCDVQTSGYGADAVIITAASKDRSLVDQSIQLCRSKGRIVVVGTADIHPDRNELWLKEIELVVSRAAGPGSLDPLYELEGVDLPIGEVRWTQKRNLQEFLRLIADKKVDVASLITHHYNIDQAESVYAQFVAGELVQPIGVLLTYPNSGQLKRSLPVPTMRASATGVNTLQIGVIGAGLFGKALLLPALKGLPNVALHTLATGSGASVEHSSRKFGFANQTTEPATIWGDKDIHAVVGLTPHSQHAKLVQTAIQNNKALFLEKPLCINEEELAELRQAAAAAHALPVIFVGHNRRYSPHTIQMQKWLASRQGPLVLQMRMNTGFVPTSHWVHSEDEGRSRIVGEVSHFIDLIECLANAAIVRVSAERISGDNRSAVNNDNVAMSFKLADGSVGTLIYSASGDKAYSREMTELFFDGKTISSKDFRISELHAGGKTITFKTSSQEMGYQQELEKFVAAVQGDLANAPCLDKSFSTMAVIFAIERALATARVESLT